MLRVTIVVGCEDGRETRNFPHKLQYKKNSNHLNARQQVNTRSEDVNIMCERLHYHRTLHQVPIP